MADARIQAEELETQSMHLIKVTRTTAGDMSDAAELLVDRRGHFTELGSQARRGVEGLADRNLGALVAGPGSEVVPQEVQGRLALLGRGGTGLRRPRVADDRA